LRLQTFLRQASNNNTRTVYALKCDVKQFFASVDHSLLRQLLALRIADTDILALLDKVIDSFQMKAGKGIPLGNLTSQLFANVYLHELDWYAKQTLKAHHYLRYCDDFIIVSTDREYLTSLVEKLSIFLSEALGLTLHPNKVSLHSWQQGIDFLGYVVKPNATLLRHKTKQRLLAQLNEKNLASYLGVCSHADSYELQQTCIMNLW
jgi:RNA-directed DNA polymerase